MQKADEDVSIEENDNEDGAIKSGEAWIQEGGAFEVTIEMDPDDINEVSWWVFKKNVFSKSLKEFVSVFEITFSLYQYVIIVGSSFLCVDFLFYCILCYHSFQINPGDTHCVKHFLFFLLQLLFYR